MPTTNLDAAIAALSAGGDSDFGDIDPESSFGNDTSEGFGVSKPKVTIGSKSKEKAAKGKKVTKADLAEDAREIVEGVSGQAWAYAGMAVALKVPEPMGPPMGVMMQLQGPVAGKHLANLIERTPLLSILQPLAEQSGLIADIAALIMPPLLVGIIASNPMLIQAVGPIFQQMMIPMARDIVEARRKKEALLGTMGEGVADPEVANELTRIMGMFFQVETEDA